MQPGVADPQLQNLRLSVVRAIFIGMTLYRTILLIPALFFVAFSQQDQIVFERITMEQGLSQSSIFSIAQDTKGFLWFGTQEGLNKYDGYTFKIYRHTSFDSLSLSDNYISSVLVDRSGTIWVGTQFGGLNRFVAASERFVHYASAKNDPATLSDNYVISLYEDRSGVLWVCTVNGLNKKEKGEEKFTRFYPDPARRRGSDGNVVRRVYEDSRNRFWVGIQGAIARCDRGKNQFHFYDTEIPITAVNGFVEDSLGTLWCVTGEGLFRFNGTRWVLDQTLDPSDSFGGESILKDNMGLFWIGTKEGLIRFDPYTKKHFRFRYNPLDTRSLGGNTALSLFEDRTGIIWIGTFDGISKYASRQSRFRHIALTPDKLMKNGGWNKIRSFAESRDGMIWIATQEGLMRYDRNTNSLVQYEGKNAYKIIGGTGTIWSLQTDLSAMQPSLWIGSNGNGLIRMRTSSGISAQPVYTYFRTDKNDPSSISGNTVWSMLQDASGKLWTGMLMDGLNRFDPSSQSFTRYRHEADDTTSLGDNTIWSLYEDRLGKIWIGTAGGGLNRFLEDKNEFIRYQNDRRKPNSISDNKITSIIEDRRGTLWIGTYAGLNRFDPETETFKIYTMKEGLPNEVIYAILEDNAGDLWISTNKGLSRFNIENETFRNYDVGDGLQNNEFNMGAAFKSRSGELFFGGVNGFNIFRPEMIVDNPVIPPVVITDIKLSGTSLPRVSGIDTLVLSYNDAVFSFSFASLDFTNPLKNRYAFMLEGFDPDWRHAGSRREATYTNIDPGEYTFRVKGSNNDGIWNDAGASLVIIITPPWWGTWWFRGILVIAFLSVGPIIYFRRVTALKKKNFQQQEFSRQLIGSQEQERKRIAAELHDSIGQDLLIIKNKLLAETDDGTAKTQPANLNDIIEYVTKSLKNVREISRNLRPIQLDQLGLTTALESVLETVADSSHITFTMHLDIIDGLLSKENEINLFRIVQECLNNILKHSHATAVHVDVRKTPGVVTMTIKDNGAGIPAGGGKRGFGMSSMQERARILGGALEVVSQDGKGTSVVLTIPVDTIEPQRDGSSMKK